MSVKTHSDGIAFIRAYLDRGGSVYRLAKESGVPATTIYSWLERGEPKALESWRKVMAAIRDDHDRNT